MINDGHDISLHHIRRSEQQTTAASIAQLDEVEKVSDLDNCCFCGKDIRGMVRVENAAAGYARCLKCGLGVTKRVGA